MTAVEIVIPAFDGGQQLLSCISAVLASKGLRTSVVVVDNASTDGSIELAMREFPEVAFLKNQLNRGFAAACNQGIALAFERCAEFVMVLNQDAFLEPDTLASMVQLAHDYPTAAAIGCRTLSTGTAGGQPGTLLYNGAWKGWPALWQRVPGIARVDVSLDQRPRQVDFVWGHAMLLRCESLRDVGLFDSAFVFYMEDLDLCDRLQQAGWHNWCDSRVVCWHAIADAARATHSEGWRWHMKLLGMRRYYRKRLPRWRAEAHCALNVLREGVSLVRHGHWRAASHLMIAALRILRESAWAGKPRSALPAASTASLRRGSGCRTAQNRRPSNRGFVTVETADM